MNSIEESLKTTDGGEAHKMDESPENKSIEGYDLENLFAKGKNEYPGRDLIIIKKDCGIYIIKPGRFTNHLSNQ